MIYKDSDCPQKLYDCDIDTVVKAIAILDKDNRYMVKVEYDGKKEEYVCFRFYQGFMLGWPDREVFKLSHRPLIRPSATIAYESITEVMPISFDEIIEDNKDILKRIKD